MYGQGTGTQSSGDTGERGKQRKRETVEGFYLRVTKSAPTVRQSASKDGKGGGGLCGWGGKDCWRNGSALNGGILPFLWTHTHTPRHQGDSPREYPSEVIQPTAPLSHQCPKTGEMSVKCFHRRCTVYHLGTLMLSLSVSMVFLSCVCLIRLRER